MLEASDCNLHGNGVLDDAREGAMADIPVELTSGKGTASRDRWGRQRAK